MRNRGLLILADNWPYKKTKVAVADISCGHRFRMYRKWKPRLDSRIAKLPGVIPPALVYH